MDQPTEIKERTQINKRLRPGEATSPAPSCTSLQSDQSMDRPKEFKDVTHGIQMNERLRPDDTISPTPSCTSLKSDQSMDRPIRFKDRTKSLRLRPDDTVSPAPSCTSLKSDQSMDRPIEFKDRTQHFIKNERLRPDDTISPTPSCTSLKSDQSMDRPIRFKDRTKSLRLRPDDTVSPAPSCTSLKSDQSMDRPIEFKDRTQHFIKNERLRPDDTISPTPSCTSLKSDQSMDRPIEFKDRTKSLSTLSATLLTEDHYRCSVCTEVFKDPVSIPCGHSYCKHCIEIYWSKPTQAGCYACPQCRKRFRNRPVLYVNVALAKVIEELKQAGFSPALPAHCYAGPDDVPCDICTGMKLRAVKSCLTCTASFCETHIRQHYTVPALQRHNLVEPGNFSHDNETFRISRAEEELQEEIKGLTATVAALKMTLREKDTRAKRLCKGFEVHCHDFPYDAIEVVTLGRPLSLGMLYDTNSDSYCKDTFLWNEGIISSMRVSLPRPQTEVKVLEGDSLQERFRILEMSPVLRTKALHGLIEMIGAAAFLNHPVQSEHQDRVTLHYKTTTRLDMISQRLLQEGIPPSVINSTSATHVIIAVCYGAQAFFVFDHVQIGSEKTSKMKNVIKKVTSSFCASQINLNLSDNEKSLSLFYNCSLFIDVGDLKSPVSFDKAVEIYGSLPMLLGSKGENAVPMKVWLYPLKNLDKTSVCALLRGVSKSLMQRAENVLGHLKNQIRKCQDFMSSPGNLSVIIWFPALKDKLANFSELLHKYQAHFQKGITEIAEAIHVKEEEGENRLQHLLDRHDQSPFSAENTNQWLENKETELKILNDCRAADIPVVKSQAELQQVLSHSQKTRVMCLTLTSPEKEDLFLSTLKQEFESDHIIQRDSLVFKPVLISQKVLFDMQLFIAVKEANEDTEQTKFIAVIVPDVCDEYTVQFYHAGMIVSRNVKLGLKPNVPQIVQIKQTSVSLMLNHLLNKRTERYVVEYRVVADGGNNNSWKQTTVFAEKCVLSGLKTESEYQLRYAVGDNQCMSNFSRIIRFKTSSAAIPGKPSVNKLNRETLKITWLKAEANCPVLHYMVEYKEAGLKGWSSVLTQGPQCECTLTVPHSTCYTVRVSAVYKDITSKPSEETSVPVEVWIINLAEIKSSNLLEVFKLQRLRKPVELIGWSDEESEMRGFLQCLPYISQLSFYKDVLYFEKEKKSAFLFLLELSGAALKWDTSGKENFSKLLTSVCSYSSFPCDENITNSTGQCEFLLDLYTHIKDYDTQTGRSVLPALQPIYQSAPAVWTINLSERKSSILLEVLKLQTKKKPVKLIDWSDEESEVRGFLQCLPYISQLRFTSPEKETFEEWENRKRLFVLNHCLQAALHQKEAIGKTMETLLSSVYYEKSDFLLDMYSIANEYETQTGRSVLPALQPIYQSAPAVWYIDISEGKSSILLEVLKLQTAKKPVELKRLSLVEGDFRGFLQCLPYISELRFYKDVLEEGQKKRSALLCLLNLSIAASECVSTKGANLISSVCSYTNFPCGKVSEYHPPDNAFQTKQCNFLLDLYSHVKDYESQTGRSVLPALQPIYQSVPAVWIINLSGRKSSILLEVLKLQTEKKPVELKDWSDEESEVRGFLQFLPYISELRFTEPQQKSSELWEKRKRLLFLNLCLQAALYQKETIEATAKILLSFVYYEKCDFLLDLYSHVKDYESQTGRSVLPVLQPIYQSVPEVWIINLSERKSSILLEVLKLQTEKKPVKLRDWSDEESEVRGFLQCLPYISQLRFDFAVQFLVNLIVAASEIDTTGENYTELLTSVCSYTSFPCDKNYSYKTKQCDFLLDLYSHVKDYEIQTGRSVLPALQPIYQSAPEVWIINLSERKSSILLEVLKLQTEKKPVELMGWSDEESEVRGFLQCLPYISQLRFGVKIVYKRKESVVQFLVNLTVAASEFDTTTGENYTELLTSVCSYTSFPCDEDDDDDYSEFEIEQGDFLLDLYSHVKDYESQTGRSVLPALQPIYQSVPAVWIINLSERKSSILLEVLKLQTEKKPVELMGWSDEENEVRGFLQCLPYISQLRFSPIVFDEEESEDTLQFLVNLIVAASKCETDTGENYTELLTSVCSYTSFPYDDDNYYKTKQCDFLLDLCSHVKDYESQTGRSVLPALQPIYQSVPAVWIINLSERKSSILLEVLKLQTEKKPVELRDWSDEESEVRGFLQCLPYISQLRFGVKIVYKRKESAVQFLVNLIVAASEIDTTTGENYTELLTSVCSYTSFPFDDDDNYYKTRQCDFLLDLYSHVKDYESQTGRSVLPALQPIYQSAPAVWIINLSERKSSILLEVLKLQTEKKPVELIDWSDEESEVRGFLQCLPYISQLRNAEQYFPSLCKVFGSRVKADQVTPLLQALNFTVTLSGILHSSTCRSVGRVLGLSSSKLNLTLNPQAISLKGVRLLFKHITHLHKLSLRKNILLKIVRALRSVDDCRSLAIEELSLVMRNTKTLKQNHSRILSKLSVFLSLWTVRCLDLTKCKIEALPLTPLLQVQGPLTIRFSKETLQQLVEMVFEAHDDELTRLFLEKVSEDLSSCSLSWEVIHYLLQCKSLNFKLDFRKIKVSSENIRELLPLLEGIQFKRLSPSFTLSIMMEIYETRSPQYVSRLLSSSESYISLNNRVLDSVHCAALRFTLEHCNTVKLNLFWTSIPEGELESILPLLKGVSELSVDRQLLLKLLHCCSSSDHQQEAAAVLLSALQNILDFSCCSALDLTDTQHNQDDFNLTTRDCKIILSVLQQTQSIVKVVLKDCEVSDKAMNELLPILPKVQLRCSKALLLHFLACISKGTKRSSLRWFKALSRALGGEMDLSHTPIDLKACEKLALFLEYSEGLSELDLSHCKLTDECMKPLIPHLHKTQTLDLSHNKVTDESARRIHSIVSTHSNIQTVRLFGNKIKDGKLFIRDNRFEIW
ncbi:uncharacterized protein si:ch211-281l24.3 isoform X26 [Myxocyprinus asiaticus]|uniref:uncharacterized protein si:ch211-281l24.3 isoform X26 n=1 Tax=Myxocyprinus asiaticus TaxID=70543 RepID=UPI002221B533|nr:uncharacterized protein si:ch211-281l24.3 isoform X26 [Myxocyprinus asiaticus]